MEKTLLSIRERVLAELAEAKATGELEKIRVGVLGKKGELTGLLRGMGKLSPEERPRVGQMVNEVRAVLEEALQARAEVLKASEKDARLLAETIDVTLPGPERSAGSLHPMNIALTKMIAKCKGERHRSKTLFKLSTGGNDKNFKGDGVCAWLTRDRKIVEEYLASEGCGYIFTANGYLNLFSLLKHTYEGDRYALKNKTLPIFFVAGSDDPVIVSEEKWAKAQAFLREIGYENVSGKLYHQFRHEILNEIGKEEVYADLLSFVEAE
jgi:hypothetical protein